MTKTTSSPGVKRWQVDFRRAVMRRDGFRCRDCHVVGVPHNLCITFIPNPDGPLDLDDIFTLCRSCQGRRNGTVGGYLWNGGFKRRIPR